MREPTRLETVSIERPCPKQWSELVGDERRRHCDQCQLQVTNLSALTRAEGEAFLASRTGRVCVTYVPAAGGGARPLAARRSRGFASSLARLAAAGLGILALLPGCRPAEAQPDERGGPQDGGGADGGRLVGKVRVDAQCVVDDEQMLLGELAAPDRPQEEGSGDAGGGPDASR